MSFTEYLAVNTYVAMLDHAELFRVKDIAEILALVDNIHYGIELTRRELSRLEYFAALTNAKTE